jgi:hypothetical protein
MEQPGALASVLRSLDREASRARGLQARRRAVDTFSVEAVVDQMLAMYDSVLANRPGARRLVLSPAR